MLKVLNAYGAQLTPQQKRIHDALYEKVETKKKKKDAGRVPNFEKDAAAALVLILDKIRRREQDAEEKIRVEKENEAEKQKKREEEILKNREIGRAVQQECRDRSRMPSSA
eukprot:TRINITY_DN48180_c0_g1_i2.p1 TRINITY_DN48180_c0_g1~~TRINITY_DN48180_c0_g1_i2.p1  ORF type:complete len:111 (-),score=38.35 TRINITY_DN48180_c0_g1_i2:11-343(-)